MSFAGSYQLVNGSGVDTRNLYWDAVNHRHEIRQLRLEGRATAEPGAMNQQRNNPRPHGHGYGTAFGNFKEISCCLRRAEFDLRFGRFVV